MASGIGFIQIALKRATKRAIGDADIVKMNLPVNRTKKVRKENMCRTARGRSYVSDQFRLELKIQVR